MSGGNNIGTGLRPVQTRLASALRLARDVAAKNVVDIQNIYDDELSVEDSEAAPEPHALVFGALEEAMRTLIGLPDQEAAWLFSQGFWPSVVHDREEQLANYKARLQRIISGEESIQHVYGCKDVPSPEAIGRMIAIFEVYPKCLTGRHRQRDWKILCFLAKGYTIRVVGRLTNVGHPTALARKEVQCRQIALRLAEVMPGPVVSSVIASEVKFMTDRHEAA